MWDSCTQLLPGAIGGARNLIAMALAVACVTAGLWAVFYAGRLLTGALRWAVASRQARSPAPPGRFLPVTGASKWTRRSRGWPESSGVLGRYAGVTLNPA